MPTDGAGGAGQQPRELPRLPAGRASRPGRAVARCGSWPGTTSGGNPVAAAADARDAARPGRPEAPAAAYLQARSLLRRGEAVGIFPEAGVSTSYTVRALMPGAVALARETGAPLVPLAIWGPQRILTAHRPVDLHRGRPVSLLGRGADGTSARTTDLREGTRTARWHACRAARRPADAARCTEPRAGGARAVAPGPPRRAARRTRRTRGTLESLPRSALVPTWLPPAGGSGSRRWSGSASAPCGGRGAIIASRRSARSRWWCGAIGPLTVGHGRTASRSGRPACSAGG